MLAEIGTVCFHGISACPITVQVQIVGGGLPSFSIVGLPDKAVNESRERIRAALHSLGLGLPPKRITLNLSPANIQKEGSHYDLPMALGILGALDILPLTLIKTMIALGELSLDGSIKPVRGVLSAALLASAQKKTFICPKECGGQAAWGGDLEILAPGHLLELMNHFKGTTLLLPPESKQESFEPYHQDFSDIHGQESAKRAILIAAAGRHNILMSGPPGAGKSMLASRIMGILPPLSAQEALEVTMIHSLGGALKEEDLVRKRPFRNPHHSVSTAALVGGGLKGLPGEVSFAHRGVLFLDELPEFHRATLESLRQPLESREAVVARANYRAIYPADFQLVSAMNPCKCGLLGDIKRQCVKAPICGKLYRNALSRPFLDRIDMALDVPHIHIHHFTHTPKKPLQNPDLLEKVSQTWAKHHALKLSPNPSVHELDAALSHCIQAQNILAKASEKFQFSARSYYKSIHLARTIALVEGDERITATAMGEALGYRIHDIFNS